MLTLIVFTPLIAALSLLFVNKDDARAVRNISVGAAGFTFLASLVLLTRFDSSMQGMQFSETLAWVPMFHINYQVGVDGISLWLVVLTAFISLIAVCFSLDGQVGGNSWRFCSLRFDFILCVLGVNACSYLFFDRNMGRGTPRLCYDKVCVVYTCWKLIDVACNNLVEPYSF